MSFALTGPDGCSSMPSRHPEVFPFGWRKVLFLLCHDTSGLDSRLPPPPSSPAGEAATGWQRTVTLSSSKHAMALGFRVKSVNTLHLRAAIVARKPSAVVLRRNAFRTRRPRRGRGLASRRRLRDPPPSPRGFQALGPFPSLHLPHRSHPEITTL